MNEESPLPKSSSQKRTPVARSPSMAARARSTLAMAAVSVISKQMQDGGTPNCAKHSRTMSAKSGLESVCPERLMENSAGSLHAAVAREAAEVGERALDDPAVDRAHQVVSLGHRDEGHGQDELAARLAHAQQRLHARRRGREPRQRATTGW